MSLKQTSLMGAWRKTRVFDVIVEMKDIEGGIAKNTLQL